ncbi:hypothetical protein [Streptomyces orinoci]|uniref:Secreted protein n=1 Tax=Streptomyces orinoci TaxID=67339 RepID=A0ABV3K0C6_STRON|nr:hypothetical protein [Streptomyces orinoci]
MRTARLMTMVLAAVVALSAAPLAAAKPGPRHLTLSNKDNRQTVVVHTGDEIDVRLSGERKENSDWLWSAPSSANGAVLHRHSTGRAAGADTVAVFHAHSDGTTTLDSELRCVSRKSGYSCSRVAVPWEVTVTVKTRKKK